MFFFFFGGGMLFFCWGGEFFFVFVFFGGEGFGLGGAGRGGVWGLSAFFQIFMGLGEGLGALCVLSVPIPVFHVWRGSISFCGYKGRNR